MVLQMKLQECVYTTLVEASRLSDRTRITTWGLGPTTLKPTMKTTCFLTMTLLSVTLAMIDKR